MKIKNKYLNKSTLNIKTKQKMKTMKRTILLAIILIAFGLNSIAQVTSLAATATASVVSPITIAVTTNMNFGSLAATGGGTLTLDFGTTVTPSAGVAVIAGSPTAARFTINGAASESIVFSFPATITLTAPSSATMSVTGITSDLGASGTTTSLSGTGVAILNIGGVLNVANNQAAGVYTNTTDLTVTANYN